MTRLLLLGMIWLLGLLPLQAQEVSLRQTTSVHQTPVFSQGGQFLLVAGGEPKSPCWNLWDLPKGKLVQTFAAPRPALNELVQASFSRDAKTIALAYGNPRGGDLVAEVWRDGKKIGSTQHMGYNLDTNVAISPDGSRLLLARLGREPRGKHVEKLFHLATNKMDSYSPPWSFLGWSPENQLFCSGDGSIQLVHPDTRKVSQRWKDSQAHLVRTREGWQIKNAPEPKFPPSGWAYLGRFDLGLRFEGRMGKGQVEIFRQSSDQVIAAWPEINGYQLSWNERILAVSTQQGVVLVDLEKTEQSGRLAVL